MQQTRHRSIIRAAQGIGIIILSILLLTQCWFLPALALQRAAITPDLQYLMIPYLILCELIVSGFDCILLALLVLLNMVNANQVFSLKAHRWTSLIIYAAAFDTLLLLILTVHTTFIAHAGTLLINLLLAGGTIVGLIGTLVMLVMRDLLDSATAQHDELEAVI